MFKLLFLLILINISIYAKDKVEIYAGSIESKDNIVNASGGVTVIYKDYILNSKSAIYNKKSEELDLFGNVRAVRGTDYKLLGENAKLNLANKERTFQPFFMLEKKSNVWISGDKGYSQDKDTEITSGVVSGCKPSDPLWKMKFSSASYNSDSKWLNLYNTTLYIYDIPVIYTPYFGYSLDTTRRTGLLVPAFGISDIEGFYYEQPIYIAEQNWWDLELKPQIRTNRGSGIYSTFRFADSPTSGGEITTGYFKEKQSYFTDQKLANDSHYGYNLKYENGNFINQWFKTSFDGQSGMYVDIQNMNDVDYINLSTNDVVENATATQVLSRINLFYNNDKNYFGAYFKHYKDLTLESNENTLQKLPTFQYHNYLTALFKDHLLYDIDVQSTNITRDINKKVLQTNVNIPVTLQTSLLDEYLNLSYTSQLYAQHSSFSGNEDITTGQYHDGYFTRYSHLLSESTQLTKAYEEFTHVINFGSTFAFKGAESRSGYYDDAQDFCSLVENQSMPQCEFYNVPNVKDTVKLNFSQYIFDLEARQILYHKLSQVINTNESSSNRLGDLENELDYQITNSIRYYNNMFYNYDEHSFSKMFNQISYNTTKFNLSFAHLYRDTFLHATPATSSAVAYTPFTSYVTSSATYNYDEHYSYHATYNYDLENRLKKSSEIGFLYKKRCWEFGIRYLENIRPILQDGVSSSISDKYIFFTIVLKPFMVSSRASDFSYKLP
jgi:LPS-assembly protein